MTVQVAKFEALLVWIAARIARTPRERDVALGCQCEVRERGARLARRTAQLQEDLTQMNGWKTGRSDD